MRDKYIGYYPPTNDELDRLWTTGLIIFDTNALLSLYRYSEETREELLKVLKKSRARLWIPFRVGFEFQRRRLDVIHQQRKAYDDVLATLEKSRKALVAELQKYTRHSSLPAESSISLVNDSMAKVKSGLESALEAHEKNAPDLTQRDEVWDSVTDIFSGRVGDGFTQDELAAIFDDGRKRYSSSTPPGYKDAAKGEPDSFGDLIIWKEILRYAKSQSLDVIFVTDDTKEDWWQQTPTGHTIGPRVELVQEFHDETEKRVHFYGTLRFLRYAIDRLEAEVSAKSLGEVEQVTERLNELALLRVENESLTDRQASLVFQLHDARLEAASAQSIEDQTEDIREREDTLMRQISNAVSDLGADRKKLRDFEKEFTETGVMRRTENVISLRQQISRKVDYVDRLESELKALRANARDSYSARVNRVEIGRRIHNLEGKLQRINQALEINQSAIDRINEPELDD